MPPASPPDPSTAPTPSREAAAADAGSAPSDPLPPPRPPGQLGAGYDDVPLTARVMRRLLRQAIYFAVLVVLFILFVFSVRRVLPLFLFSVILAYLLSRPVSWVATNTGRRGIPRGVAVLLIYAVLLGLLAFAFDRLSLVVVHEVRAFAANWPTLQLTLGVRLLESERIGMLSHVPQEAQAWVEQTFYNLDSIVRDQVVHTAPSIVHRVPDLIELIVVPIVAYYLLKDYETFVTYMAGLIQPDRPDRFRALVGEIDHAVRGYVRGQAVLSAVAGVLAFAILTAFGVHYAALVGVSAVFLELLPVVGPLTWAAVAVLLTAIEQPDKTVWVLVLVTLAHQADMHILAPNILGRHLRLHPAVVIFALVSGTALMGLLGALLAAPAAAVLTIVVRYLMAEGALSTRAVLSGVTGRQRAIAVPDGTPLPPPSREDAAAPRPPADR